MNNADNFFQSLCEQYYADLGNFLLALAKDRELAQDLLQETFIVAWNKRELLLTHPNPAGFLFQTARLCLKHARQKQKKQQSRVLYLDREQLAQQKQEQHGNDPWEELCLQQDAAIDETKWITAALQQLSDEEYLLYRQHYLEKKTFVQLAQEHQQSAVCLRMRALRIRKNVQKAVRQLALEEFSDQSCIQSSKGGIQHEKTC